MLKQYNTAATMEGTRSTCQKCAKYFTRAKSRVSAPKERSINPPVILPQPSRKHFSQRFISFTAILLHLKRRNRLKAQRFGAGGWEGWEGLKCWDFLKLKCRPTPIVGPFFHVGIPGNLDTTYPLLKVWDLRKVLRTRSTCRKSFARALSTSNVR